MMPETYYLASAGAGAGYAPLEGRREARVAIVGGGYAGLNTALGLAERGVRDVVLLEAEQLGYGASGRNGGFVFAGYSLGEGALLKQLGAERARALYAKSVAAVNLIRQRVQSYALDCDTVDAGVLWANWFQDPEVLRSRQRLLAENYAVDWQYVERDALRAQVHSERYSAALYERNALHLHPLKFARGLAQAAAGQGVSIHERSRVRALQRNGAAWRISTEGGNVEAEHVVLACGGYLAGLVATIDRAVLPVATYVMATEPLGDRLRDALATRAAVYDTRFAFDYYRPLADTRLLWGGRISIANRAAADVAKLLRRDLQRVFPQLAEARIDYAWSGLMSYARHQMPQLGRHCDGLWYAQAFGGHGVAPTTAAGEMLAAAIAEGDGAWQALQPYGLVSAFKPFGLLGAQANYWWYQACDALKDWRETGTA